MDAETEPRSAELGHDALDAANSAEWLPAQSDQRFDSADSPLAAGLSQNETRPVMSDAPNIAVTYPQDTHPEYALLRRRIEQSPNTFVLVPSFNREICVAETVRRQLRRPFAGSAEREEAVIRERFSVYVGLRAFKIETRRSLIAIVDELVAAVAGESDLYLRVA